jgi:hypothetical protein
MKSGYIFINAKGQRLNQHKAWYSAPGYMGYIWSINQARDILTECGTWQVKPTHYQPAYFEGGYVRTSGSKMPVETFPMG